MLIRTMFPLLIDLRHYEVGEVVEVAELRALELIHQGYAEPPPVIETATKATPPRRATRLSGKAESSKI